MAQHRAGTDSDTNITDLHDGHSRTKGESWQIGYVFLIRSSAGCKKYVTRLRLVTYFLQPAQERIKNTYCIGKRPFLFLLLIYMRFLTIFYAKTTGLSFIADVVRHYDSERVCRWGVFLNSVRPMGSTPFNAFPLWVIFCHYVWTLMSYWLLFTFMLNVRCHSNHL